MSRNQGALAEVSGACRGRLLELAARPLVGIVVVSGRGWRHSASSVRMMSVVKVRCNPATRYSPSVPALKAGDEVSLYIGGGN